MFQLQALVMHLLKVSDCTFEEQDILGFTPLLVQDFEGFHLARQWFDIQTFLRFLRGLRLYVKELLLKMEIEFEIEIGMRLK